MEQILLSVIIPTYNRKSILGKTLKALEKQSISKNKFEVIVVDDGSTDGTPEKLDYYASSTDLNVQVYHQENRGQGPARNLAIEKSIGKYLLIIGDDIIPDAELIEKHLQCHERESNSVAVLGFIDWHKDQEITEFMQFMAPYGPQFNYTKAEIDVRNLSFGYFYTSNVSLERKWLLTERFDNDFNGYGCEDHELGLRLIKKGLKIVFFKEARAYHLHPLSKKVACYRARIAGEQLFIFFQKHPDIYGTIYLRRFITLVWVILFILYKLKIGKLFGKKLYWKSMIIYCQYTGFLQKWLKSTTTGIAGGLRKPPKRG